MGCAWKLFWILVRLALILACICAIIWALGQLTSHDVISGTEAWIRWCLSFKNWLDNRFGVKG